MEYWSNTGGAFGASSSHRGEGEVVVRIDGAATPRADPTSVGANDFAGPGGPSRLQSRARLPELGVAGQPRSPPKPSLNEVDSFDEHFRVPSAVTSRTATAGGGGNFSELPPRPNVEFTDSCRKEDGGGGRQDDEHVHVQSAVSSPRAAGEEVAKGPTQLVFRTNLSRLNSRLADRPKPIEVPSKASGVIEKNKMKSSELKSGLPGNKLKKVDEEEEDFLKDTDLPEKFRRRDKGLWTILQWSALLIILAGLVCVLSIPTLRKMNRGGLALWKWVVLVMVVFCGRLISGWIVRLVVINIEKSFLLRTKVVYFVYALRKKVQNCLWLGFALVTWHSMIEHKVDKHRKVVHHVTKALLCFLVAAIIVLVKTFIVKVVASSFHMKNYFGRIQEALFNQYIMVTLAGPPLYEDEDIARPRAAGAIGPAEVPPRPSVTTNKSPMIGARQQSGVIGRNPRADEAKKKTDGSKAELDKGISVDHLQKLNSSNISAWSMKRLIHIITTSTLTYTLEETVNSANGAEIAWEAKRKAEEIFPHVAKDGQEEITEDDLMRFMDEELVKKTFEKFEGGEFKRITKQALEKWAILVYKERRALRSSLTDTKTAVTELHRIIDVLVSIIIIVIWILLLGIATYKVLLLMSSQILLLILVWGNALRTVFEAIVFLFVMHPFDVGDRCLVDGMQLVVLEMNILTTVFLGEFDAKVWYPNSVLATKPIQNFFRSPEMGDGIEFTVQANTPGEKITDFKERIGKYIQSKPEHWHKVFVLNVVQMSEGEKMKLSLGVKHTISYQDFGEITERRSDLLLKMKSFLMELGIE